jgi:hypothetical protein
MKKVVSMGKDELIEQSSGYLFMVGCMKTVQQ